MGPGSVRSVFWMKALSEVFQEVPLKTSTLKREEVSGGKGWSERRLTYLKQKQIY